MRLLLGVSLLASVYLVQGRAIFGPIDLGDIDTSNYSTEAREFITTAIEKSRRFMEDVTLNSGTDRSFDEIYDNLADLATDFLLLPIEIKKELLPLDNIETDNVIPAFISGLMFARTHVFKEIDSDQIILFDFDTYLAIIKESWTKFDWINQTQNAIDYIRQKDKKLGGGLEVFVRKAKEHYDGLNSDEGRAFVSKAVQYIYNRRDKPMNVVEIVTDLTAEFRKLTKEQAKDVVAKMSWLVKNFLKENLYEKYAAVAASADKILLAQPVPPLQA